MTPLQGVGMHNPGIDRYRRQQLESLRPEQLVLVALEQGIRACRCGDRRKARRVVQTLINGLDFDYEVAGNLLMLYDWTFRLLREGRFTEAEQILTEVHATWARATGPAADDTVYLSQADQEAGSHPAQKGVDLAG